MQLSNKIRRAQVSSWPIPQLATLLSPIYNSGDTILNSENSRPCHNLSGRTLGSSPSEFRGRQHYFTAISFVALQICPLLGSLPVSLSTLVMKAHHPRVILSSLPVEASSQDCFRKAQALDNEIAVAFPRITELEISNMTPEFIPAIQMKFFN